MVGASRRYGVEAIARFRRADQSLPGKVFPLLPVDDDAEVGRYVFVMDGQWRVRDVEQFQRVRRERGSTAIEFGACPLPYPTAGGSSGRRESGWVNGNFFLVPRGARNSAGAWEFIKFWIGLSDLEQAAQSCIDGGWIPVSRAVVESRRFQEYLAARPLMARFVAMSASPNLFPYPQVPGAMYFQRAVNAAAETAINNPERPVGEILRAAQRQIQAHVDGQRRAHRPRVGSPEPDAPRSTASGAAAKRGAAR
jgi:multiple sugar transport system substrate-binding protein